MSNTYYSRVNVDDADATDPCGRLTEDVTNNQLQEVERACVPVLASESGEFIPMLYFLLRRLTAPDVAAEDSQPLLAQVEELLETLPTDPRLLHELHLYCAMASPDDDMIGVAEAEAEAERHSGATECVGAIGEATETVHVSASGGSAAAASASPGATGTDAQDTAAECLANVLGLTARAVSASASVSPEQQSVSAAAAQAAVSASVSAAAQDTAFSPRLLGYRLQALDVALHPAVVENAAAVAQQLRSREGFLWSGGLGLLIRVLYLTAPATQADALCQARLVALDLLHKLLELVQKSGRSGAAEEAAAMVGTLQTATGAMAATESNVNAAYHTTDSFGDATELNLAGNNKNMQAMARATLEAARATMPMDTDRDFDTDTDTELTAVVPTSEQPGQPETEEDTSVAATLAAAPHGAALPTVTEVDEDPEDTFGSLAAPSHTSELLNTSRGKSSLYVGTDADSDTSDGEGGTGTDTRNGNATHTSANASASVSHTGVIQDIYTAGAAASATRVQPLTRQQRLAQFARDPGTNFLLVPEEVHSAGGSRAPLRAAVHARVLATLPWTALCTVCQELVSMAAATTHAADADADLQVTVALAALKVLAQLLQLRPELLTVLYGDSGQDETSSGDTGTASTTAPSLAAFAVDGLVHARSGRLRLAMRHFFQIVADLTPPAGIEPPRNVLLRVLIAARLPFWQGGAAPHRPQHVSLQNTCGEYFSLLSFLVQSLALDYRGRFHGESLDRDTAGADGAAASRWRVPLAVPGVDFDSLLEDEVTWLQDMVDDDALVHATESVHPSAPTSSTAGASTVHGPDSHASDGAARATAATRAAATAAAEAATTPPDAPTSALLQGHLQLCNELVGLLRPAARTQLGGGERGLLKPLLERCLFPEAVALRRGAGAEAVPAPLCVTVGTRTPAMLLVAQLCDCSAANLLFVCQWLSKYHLAQGHALPEVDEWDAVPQVGRRSLRVGLKNAGATCYMNSMLQQVAMQPALRQALLGVPEEVEQAWQREAKQAKEADLVKASAAVTATEPDSKGHTAAPVSDAAGPVDTTTDTAASAPSTDTAGEHGGVVEVEPHSTFFHVQTLLAHLEGSQQRFFVPEGFWKTFCMYGTEHVNVRQHMDAVEFFCNLGDQLDVHLKKAGLPAVFEAAFGGTMAMQKIGQSCSHRYTRLDSFSSITAVVRNNRNLREALEESVKGELLCGSNAYMCSHCNGKVDALMRACIARLPRMMVVQLKRFEYDWETQRPVKSNDRCVVLWMKGKCSGTES